MSPESTTLYEFGPFRVDPDRQLLLRDGVAIPLAPKAFEMLLVFVRRSREVVTKDELLKGIWPDSFVEEANLSQNVFLLRKALGDTGDERRYIVTLPGRGYRFAAEVRTIRDTGEALIAQMRSHTEIVIEERASEQPAGSTVALPLRRSAWSRWYLPVSIGLAVALAAVLLLSFIWNRRPTRMKKGGGILVADFVNLTGDAVFDDALRQGLEAGLQQSPDMNLVSDEDIQKALRLMGQATDTHMTGAVARDVCVRTGAVVALEGSIRSVGKDYLLTLGSTDCRSGKVLTQGQAQVTRKEDVLRALGDLTNNFRQRAGETPSVLQKHDLPLSEVTTGSLEALKAYSTGLKAGASQGDEAAIPFFKRAIELDPKFAMAYAYLALSYGSTGESGLAAQNAGRAYDLRERASDHERYFISAYYFGRATGNQEKARQVCEEWSRMYPRDPLPHAFLSGFVDLVLGNYANAIAEGQKARELAPEGGFSYVNLGEDALYVGRHDLSRDALRGAEEHKIEEPTLLVLRYDLAFTENDSKGMQVAVDAARGNPDAMDLLADRQAFSLGYAGHLRQARVFARQAVDIAQHQGDKERAAQFAVRSALREAFFGDTRDAREDAEAALALTNNRETVYGAAMVFALTGDAGRAESMAKDLEKDYPEDTSVHFNYLPVIGALIALDRKDADGALKALETAAPYELGVPRSGSTGFFGSLYPILIRGEAYLASGKSAEASREFQKIVDHRDIMIGDSISSLGQYELARSLALAGDKPRAREAFEKALQTWRDADSDLPIIQKAKTEYAKL